MINNMMRCFLILCLVLNSLFCSKNLPVGVKSEKAEQLYKKVIDASAYDMWQKDIAAVGFIWHAQFILDKVSIVHHFFWDKKRGFVEVSWDNIKVQFDKKNLKNTVVFIDKKVITDTKKIKDLTYEAYSFFINDSFWLNPLFTINSPDSEKLYVSDRELLVTFNKGGVTPGDSYLFSLDESYRINSMKMWVSTIPIKGIKVTFEDYILLKKKIPFSTQHSLLGINKLITLDKVKVYKKYPNKKEKKDRFVSLVEVRKISSKK